MKKLPIIQTIILLMLISCQNDDLEVNAVLPEWLRSQIQQDEEYIKQHPKIMPAWGIWERTEYQGEIYFEYSNMVSSLAYGPISYEQDTLSLDAHDDYLKMRCCSKVVWHGNMVDEETLHTFYGD